MKRALDPRAVAFGLIRNFAACDFQGVIHRTKAVARVINIGLSGLRCFGGMNVLDVSRKHHRDRRLGGKKGLGSACQGRFEIAKFLLCDLERIGAGRRLLRFLGDAMLNVPEGSNGSWLSRRFVGFGRYDVADHPVRLHVFVEDVLQLFFRIGAENAGQVFEFPEQAVAVVQF